MNVRRIVRSIAATWVIAGLFGIPAHAQSITRVFELSHVEPGQLASTLSLFDAQIQPNNSLRTLTVRADAAVMPAIEDVVARLDVLRVERAAEVTAYVLRAQEQGSATAIPPNLEPVVQQLRNTFAYASYALMDTLVIRGVDGGEPSTSGTIALDVSGIADRPVFYNFSGEFRVVEPDEGPNALRIDRMRFGFRIPIATSMDAAAQFQYIDVGINTDVEIPADSQVVVGKATVGDSALILVMTVEFLN